MKLLIAFAIGYVLAHVIVKNECQQLGAFYVGQTTFKCEEKK